MLWFSPQDDLLNKQKKMKAIVYKGFGLDNKGEVSFKMEVLMVTGDKVLVKVSTNDQKFFCGEREYNEGTGEFECECEIESAIYGLPIIQGSGWSDWGNSDDSMKKRDFLECKIFESVDTAISWVQETVRTMRNYWKAQKAQYNKLIVQLRELKVEDFLDENTGDEITLSQTVKIKR